MSDKYKSSSVPKKQSRKNLSKLHKVAPKSVILEVDQIQVSKTPLLKAQSPRKSTKSRFESKNNNSRLVKQVLSDSDECEEDNHSSLDQGIDYTRIVGLKNN